MAKKNYQQLENFFKKKFSETTRNPIQNFFMETEIEFQRNGFREEISGVIENILIVRLDVIGDFILTTGFIREVRKNFPKAQITLIVSPLVYPVAELCPYVNEVLQFDGKTFDRNIIELLKREVNFCRDNLWQKHFTYSFSPQCGSDNIGGLFLSYLSGAQERIGYGSYPWEKWRGISENVTANVEADNLLLTKNIPAPVDVITEVEKHFYILPETGFYIDDLSCELWFSAEDFLKAQELLQNISGRKKIVVGIGAGDDSRKYPVQKLAVALNEIAKKNFVFVVVGGKSETESAIYLEKNLPRDKILNLAGKTSLRETEAIISQSDFYIGNDSGVMHMSAAAGVPVLAIYREAQDKDKNSAIYSELRRFPPWQVTSVILRPDYALDDCAKVNDVYGGCCHFEAHCITQIEPQEIVEGFEKLVEITTSPQ